jgi:hypothetical protein
VKPGPTAEGKIVNVWPAIGAFLCVVFIGLIAFGIVVSVRQERQRREALGRWAGQNGWILQFRPATDWA